jgi:hypothetical protein
MNAFTLALLLALLWWVARALLHRVRTARQRGDFSSYRTGDAALDQALALAHPMAYHAIQGGFADRQLNGADTALAAQLRPMVLHHLGLRTDLDDAQAARQLPEGLRQRWFALDLQRLQPGDDPHAAMAFACARVAFQVRCAWLLGWLDEALQQQILHLNACRARECFDGWQAFGQAYARGRSQWLARGRADVLGRSVTAEDVAQWVADPRHPWHAMPWRSG